MIHKFSKEITMIVKIVQKIKDELQINSFTKITEKLNSVLGKIYAQKDVSSKVLAFSDMISNPTNNGNNC